MANNFFNIKFVLTGLCLLPAILVNAQIENLKPPPRMAPYVAKRNPNQQKPQKQNPTKETANIPPASRVVSTDEQKEYERIAKIEIELGKADDAYEKEDYTGSANTYLIYKQVLGTNAEDGLILPYW